MSREIKFRGNRVDTGEWVYGYYWTNEVDNHFIRVTKTETGLFVIKDYEVLPETVGQFTGLKDRNEKEIYEGDILKSLSQVFSEENQDALISEVYYHDSYAAFYLLASNRDFEINEPLAQSIHNYEILEVIGNIYENPELLQD